MYFYYLNHHFGWVKLHMFADFCGNLWVFHIYVPYYIIRLLDDMGGKRTIYLVLYTK